MMRRLLLVLTMLMLAVAPAHAAGGKKARKPLAERARATQMMPQTTVDESFRGTPAERARLEKLGPLMAEIGSKATLIADGKSDGLFVYAEIDGKQASVSVFRDRGKTVKWFVETRRLFELVEQAWAIEPPGRRWAVMALECRAGKFDARLLYPEEVDFKQPFDERLLTAMPKRFYGKKLVVERRRPGNEEETDEAAEVPQEAAEPIAESTRT